jgi:hypothetical protein
MERNGRARLLNYGTAIQLSRYQVIVPAIELYNLMAGTAIKLESLTVGTSIVQ